MFLFNLKQPFNVTVKFFKNNLNKAGNRYQPRCSGDSLNWKRDPPADDTNQHHEIQTKYPENSWRRPNNDSSQPRNQTWNKTESMSSFNKKSYNNNRGFEQQDLGATSQQSLVPKLVRSDVYKFWNQLPKRLLQLKNKFELSADEHSLWHETWKAAAGGAVGPIRALPIAYLQLPATSSLSPQPSTVLAVLIQVSEEIKQQKQQLQKGVTNNEDFPTVSVLEAVFDTVKLRLCNQVQASSSLVSLLEAADLLETSLFEALFQSIGQSNVRADKRDGERLARLMLRRGDISELKDRMKAAPGLNFGGLARSGESSEGGVEWLGWQKKPTLGWLMNGAWHRTEGLRAFYDCEKEYAETLLRVWSLLTFYWGSGAVWPRCAHRQQAQGGEGTACGEPLLAGSGAGGGAVKCRRRGCGRLGGWSCYKVGHEAVCEKCLAGQQELLVGQPGPMASTDVYDGVVEKETARKEESVYLLKNVVSRRPPKMAPNWKTSRFLIN